MLRTYVEPPFDVGQYPSPLSSFRRYVKLPKRSDPTNLYDEPMFTVDGRAGRHPVADRRPRRYDGVVWGAANDALPGRPTTPSNGSPSTIDNPVDGRTGRRDGRARGGLLRGLAADRGCAPVDGRSETATPDAKAESFRYNLATSTAVVPSGLQPR